MSFKNPSKGEQKIINILTQNNIPFNREISFNDLRGLKNSLLRFDFCIYRNNNTYILLDYDGVQHFQFTPYFHKDIFTFRKAQEWDRRKNSYCLVRNIPFLRIPYWDFDELTFEKIFSTPAYVVKDKYHNDLLKSGGVKQWT